MATFWGRVARSVINIYFLCIMLICIFFVSHFGFEDGTLVLIAPFSGHC